METLADPLDAGFGFEHVRLSAVIVEPMAASQDALEDGATHSAFLSEALVSFIEQQSIRLGPQRVQRFTAVDSHIPERATKEVPALSLVQPPDWPRSQVTDEPPSRPLSLFDPPQPVEAMAAVPDGPPRQFRWRRVLHTIVRAEGPERIAPEWWCRTGSTLTRDYYRVEDREGRRFWLFREGLYGRETAEPRWYVHGLFA
jgi:protein ImuB